MSALYLDPAFLVALGGSSPKNQVILCFVGFIVGTCWNVLKKEILYSHTSPRSVGEGEEEYRAIATAGRWAQHRRRSRIQNWPGAPVLAVRLGFACRPAPQVVGFQILLFPGRLSRLRSALALNRSAPTANIRLAECVILPAA